MLRIHVHGNSRSQYQQTIRDMIFFNQMKDLCYNLNHFKAENT